MSNKSTTVWARIRRGVRQECVMSPDLFNLYSEAILSEVKDVDEGIVVNGVHTNNMWYVDDTVFIASSPEGLQKLFNVAADASEERGLSMNHEKTKAMCVSKQSPEPGININVGDQTADHVSSFNYLGTMITANGTTKNEIHRRIVLAEDAFNKLRNILTNRKLSVKIRVLKMYIWSVLLYGVEAWNLTAETWWNLEAAEMWFYHRMLRVSFVDRVTNEEILWRVDRKRELLKMVEKRQAKFLGHYMRKGKLEDLCLSGKIKGRIAHRGQRITFFKNFYPKFGNPHKVWNVAWDRDGWKSCIA